MEAEVRKAIVRQNVGNAIKVVKATAGLHDEYNGQTFAAIGERKN
jgi:hypothetical protein